VKQDLAGEQRRAPAQRRELVLESQIAFNYRQRAPALGAKGSAPTTPEEARPIDLASLLHMRDELSALAQAG
jgi:hypothetical protein